MLSNVNQKAGSVSQIKSGPSKGKWRAYAVIGEGRGARKKPSPVFDRKGDAVAWLAQAKADGLPTGDAVTMTVLGAVDHFVTNKGPSPQVLAQLRVVSKHLAAQGIGDRKVSALKPFHIDGFVTHLRTLDSIRSPRTVNLYTDLLLRVLRYSEALTFIPQSKRYRQTVTEELTEALTRDQVEALYNGCPPRVAPLILLMAYGGMRVSEAAAICIGDINFVTNTVRVHRAVDGKDSYKEIKNRKTRTVPLPRWVVELLVEARLGRDRDERMALMSKGGNVNAHNGSNVLSDVARSIGIEATSHDLRKFFVTMMDAAGVTHKRIAWYIGDTEEVMRKTYALMSHEDDDKARAAMESERAVFKSA